MGGGESKMDFGFQRDQGRKSLRDKRLTVILR